MSPVHLPAGLVPPAMPRWASQTWEVVAGCSVISPGCAACVARWWGAMNAGPGQSHAGLAAWVSRRTGLIGSSRDEVGPGAWPHWTGDPRENPEALSQPENWPAGSLAAVAWYSDLFHDAIGWGFYEQLWEAMRYWSHVRFVILSRRYMRMKLVLSDLGPREMLENVAVGATCSNQAEVDAAADGLIRSPALVKVLCLEPLLQQVTMPQELLRPRRRGERSGLDWVLIGLETGKAARVGDIRAVRYALDQCREADVPAYVHQIGSRAHEGPNPLPYRHVRGANPAEWPEDLRVRQLPGRWER